MVTFSVERRLPLKGAIGFPVTPFEADLSLNVDALQELVAWMTAVPLAALVAAGGTGEFFSLTTEEVERVGAATVEAANGVPVIGTVGVSVPQACDAAQRLERAGVSALLVLPPYYTNATQEGLIAYYERIGGATDLPLGIYSRDWAVFTTETVERLAERIPTLQFWKDGQGDVRRLARIMSVLGDRLTWVGGVGDDCAASYFATGVDGYTSSIANLVPQLSCEIARLGSAQDFVQLEQLLVRHVHPMYALRERRRGYEISSIKEAMKLQGRDVGPARPPVTSIAPEDRPALQDALSKLVAFGTAGTSVAANG